LPQLSFSTFPTTSFSLKLALFLPLQTTLSENRAFTTYPYPPTDVMPRLIKSPLWLIMKKSLSAKVLLLFVLLIFVSCKKVHQSPHVSNIEEI